MMLARKAKTCDPVAGAIADLVGDEPARRLE